MFVVSCHGFSIFWCLFVYVTGEKKLLQFLYYRKICRGKIVYQKFRIDARDFMTSLLNSQFMIFIFKIEFLIKFEEKSKVWNWALNFVLLNES